MPQVGRRTIRTKARLSRLAGGPVAIEDLGPALGPLVEQRIEERWEILRLSVGVKREEYRAWVIRQLARGRTWREISKEEPNGE